MEEAPARLVPPALAKTRRTLLSRAPRPARPPAPALLETALAAPAVPRCPQRRPEAMPPSHRTRVVQSSSSRTPSLPSFPSRSQASSLSYKSPFIRSLLLFCFSRFACFRHEFALLRYYDLLRFFLLSHGQNHSSHPIAFPPGLVYSYIKHSWDPINVIQCRHSLFLPSTSCSRSVSSHS